MKRIKEYMNEMTKQGWITFSAIVALVVIIIISGIIFYVKNPNTWPITIFNDKPEKKFKVTTRDLDSDTFIEKAVESQFIAEKPKNDYAVSPTTQVSYAYKPEEVLIALIIEENEYDVKNIIEGVCGNVYMVTAYVPGPTVLTNSYKALFGDKIFGDFLPGNIIPSYHPSLTFKEVKIEKGVAKIYLGGSFSGARKGVCDAELALAQLEETAKSYPNVKSVEIYQDGKKIN
jgi:hypothetical protein